MTREIKYSLRTERCEDGSLRQVANDSEFEGTTETDYVTLGNENSNIELYRRFVLQTLTAQPNLKSVEVKFEEEIE